jgi:hypothetical protein
MKMKFLRFLVPLLLVAGAIASELLPIIEKRTWHFPASSGQVIVRLTSTPSTIDGRDVYSLQIICKSACPELQEEAGYLKTVTKDMTSDGWPPGRIVMIHLQAREPDVSKRLTLAAYDSQAWIKAQPSDYGPVIVRLLNEIGAYNEFNDVLAAYGFTVKVSHAENISTINPRQIGLSSRLVSRLPTSASLEMVLQDASKN